MLETGTKYFSTHLKVSLLKINIGGSPLSGFTNLTKEQFNLDTICEAAECTEIIVENTLEYFPLQEVEVLINHWVSKLRHGGTLIIVANHLTKICKSYVNKEINMADANILLFGGRQSSVDPMEVQTMFTTLGLKVLKCTLDNYRFIVKGQRP